MTTKKVKSADGTAIAFETVGSGHPLILVGGAFCDRHARASGTPLAALLAPELTVFSYDRRGRGESGDTPRWSVERELEDLAALIEEAGGAAYVYGISSGAILALHAAVRHLPIPKLALYEPPLMLDANRLKPLENVAQELILATAAGNRPEAVEIFMTRVLQLPAGAVEQMRKSPVWPGLESLAHTLSYDVRITALGPALIAEAASVRPATLALHGEACPAWMREAICALAHALPSGSERVLSGQTHDVDPKILAATLREFFAS
jgi:pimeloyl-ACP methyl ester carboxylesterase